MSKVIVSDLDGTLIKTDMLFESMVTFIKTNPASIIFILIWFFKGKSFLKSKIINEVDVDVENIPYNQEVIDYLKDEKKAGNTIVLATASNEVIANKVAAHVGIFDQILASSENLNLKSKNKAEALNEHYGEGNYYYLGDSNADIPVWRSAAGSITVNKKVSDPKINVVKEFKTKKKSFLASFIKQIRVYQWVKNILLFLPALMAHQANPNIYIDLLIAFFAFGVTASSVYVLNDLLDLNADRKHPRKKNRPFAAGDLELRFGLGLFPILFLSGFGISLAFLSKEFVLVLAIYYLITTFYSFSLKKLMIVDVLTLSSLYTIRIIAGGSAAEVEISPWLLGFSIFIFLSLAFVKRYTEILLMIKNNKKKTSGRGYVTEDQNLISTFGAAAGYIAVFVFALYINSENVRELYTKPDLLYFVTIPLVFWITRIWFLANRGEMTDDPIVFTGKDKSSWLVGLIIAAIVIYAKL